MKSDFRRNTVSGLVPIDGLHEGQVYFSEWWNGEGISFEITDKDGISNKKVLELSQDEIETLTSIFKYLGLFDDDAVKENLIKWKKEEKEKFDYIEQFKRENNF